MTAKKLSLQVERQSPVACERPLVQGVLARDWNVQADHHSPFASVAKGLYMCLMVLSVRLPALAARARR